MLGLYMVFTTKIISLNMLFFPLQALKRRSSVLYNDIGPVGPIRRIRHKPSLLSSRGLNLPVSDSPLSIPGSGVVPGAARYPSSSMQKPLLLEKSKEDSTKMLIENGDNSVPGRRFTSVPTKSSEMASKILQQLEKLVSPKEKSSHLKVVSVGDSSLTKLSPSMLHVRALRSLETVESPKFMENARDNRKLDISLDTSLPDALDTTAYKQNKDETVPLKLVAPCDISVSVGSCIDYKSPNKDTFPSDMTRNSAVMNFVTLPPQKKQAFQMSAHEVFDFCHISFGLCMVEHCSINVWSTGFLCHHVRYESNAYYCIKFMVIDEVTNTKLYNFFFDW